MYPFSTVWKWGVLASQDFLVKWRSLSTVNSYDFGGCNSAAEYLLPKQGVVGSNPITRSS